MDLLVPPRGLLADAYSPSFGITYRGELVAQRQKQIASLVGPQATFAVGFLGDLGRANAGPAAPLELAVAGEGSQAGAELLRAKLGAKVSVLTKQTLAGEDLLHSLALLDLRYAGGKVGLIEAIKKEYLNIWRLKANAFIPRLAEEAIARWAKEGELAHLSEPDLERPRGGIADLRLLGFIESSWTAAANRSGLDRAGNLLLDVRDAVEYVSGDHILRIDIEDVVSKHLGTTPYQLRHALAASALAIENATSRTLERAEDVAKGPRKVIPRVVRGIRKAPSLQIVDKSVAIHSGQIVASSKRALNDPHAILRLARAGGQKQMFLGAWTVTAMQNAQLPTSWDETGLQLLLDFLTSPGFRQIFGQLDRVSIPSKVFPLWEKLRFRPRKGQRLTDDYFQIELTYFACGLAERRIKSVMPARPLAPHPAGGVVALSALLSGFSAADIDHICASLNIDADWEDDILEAAEKKSLLLDASSGSEISAEVISQTNSKIGGSKHMLSLLALLSEANLLATGAKPDRFSALADLVYMVDEAQVLSGQDPTSR